jgi:signal transduction histidine kinase
VEVSGNAINGNAQIVVLDNGIGFDEKYAERIFTMFERLHGRAAYEGTGIGLAICRKIAQRHGGDIRARSTPGEGARFVVTLPVKHSGLVD